jgi:hypothetical protein
MNRSIPIIILLFFYSFVTGQVAEMNWKFDYQIYLKMTNDSNYIYDIRDVFHITQTQNDNFTSEFVFYPVNPDVEYIDDLSKKLTADSTYKTLWSALNAKLGGGWVHFINCLAYSIETQKLDLKDPIMKRPLISWKPEPKTDSWERTKDWEYYIPVTQKSAVKEYKIRKKNKQLGDLSNLPKSYIDLLLKTNQKKYDQLKLKGRYKEIARIDLVKIMLGANYLGESQIAYISNAVLNAVKNYSANLLPSVLIFDAFDAAAAMTLNSEGYKVNSIAFRHSTGFTEEEMSQMKEKIIEIINKINIYNQNSFKKRLTTYYKE